MAEKNDFPNETATNTMCITRVFDAPRDLVFKAFTEPKRLAKWWGPVGFVLRAITVDLRPGGYFHYCMKAGNGYEMWGKFTYREIEAPGRLVFTNSFSDEAGNITRAPFSQTWPLEVLNILTLTEENGNTTLVLKGQPVNATEEEQQTFNAGFESMQQGFKGTFDQLENYLGEHAA